MERCCEKVMIQLMVGNYLRYTDRSAEEEKLKKIRASPLSQTLVIVVVRGIGIDPGCGGWADRKPQ